MAILNLIFNGSWETVEQFDEEFDQLTEYFNEVDESVKTYNKETTYA